MKPSIIFLLAFSLGVASSCNLIKGKKKGSSSATGWAYNNPKNGGFE